MTENADTCVCCGEIIPEGMQVCPLCGTLNPDNKPITEALNAIINGNFNKLKGTEEIPQSSGIRKKSARSKKGRLTLDEKISRADELGMTYGKYVQAVEMGLIEG